MKTKYSLIPFIPAVVIAMGLKLMSIFGTDGSGLLFGMNKSTVNYVIIGVTLALFAVCVVINITDRKTAPVYAVKKNPVAGFTALLCGFAAAGSSFLNLFNITTDNSDTYLMCIITAVFSIPAAVAMILIGKIHFVGKSKVSNHSMFYVFPALWSCSELVAEFLQATKVSISASDMSPLFCYIFITLYLFSSSMIVSRVRGKNPVKACFIYGFPASVVCLAYGVGTIATATIESMGVQSLLSGAMFVAFAVYILSFTLEMFFGCVTKAEIEIIDSLPKDNDTYENSYISSGAYDELIASDSEMPEVPDEQEEQSRPRSYAEVAAEDMNDFIIGYDPDAEYASRENSTDAGAYDFSQDLILGIEGVSESEFVREMNAEPQTSANEEKPAPRTVMDDAKPQPAEFVQPPVKHKPAKRGRKSADEAKPRKKKVRESDEPRTERVSEEPKAEARVSEAPVTAPETEAFVSEDRRTQAQSHSTAPAQRRETQQTRRSAEQPNRGAQQQRPRRRPRPAAESQGAQTAHTGSRPASTASHAQRASAAEQSPARQARPTHSARPSRPAQAQSARPASQARPMTRPTQSTRTAADNSVSSSRADSYGSYGDYDNYDSYTRRRPHTASGAYSSYDSSADNSAASNDRMSDIDRLLKELEDKK